MLYVPAYDVLRSQQTITEGMWQHATVAAKYQQKEYAYLHGMALRSSRGHRARLGE